MAKRWKGKPTKGSILENEKRLKDIPEEDRWKVHYDLVWAYFDDDEYQKALDSYEACKDNIPQEDVTDLVLIVSDVLEQYGELDEAVRLLKERIDNVQEMGKAMTKEMGSLQLRLAQVLRRQSRFSEAMEHSQLALAVFTDDEVSTEEELSVLSTMGIILWDKGDYSMSLKILYQARDRGLAIGHHEKLKWIHNNIGLVNYQLGNYDETLKNYELAMSSEKTGNKSFMGLIENNIGLVHHDKGEYVKARAQYERSLRLNEEIENFVGTALGFLNLGLLEVELGNPDKGRDLLDKSISLCRQMKERWILALNTIGLARVYILKGDLKLARYDAERALRYSEEMKAKESMGMALRELGRVAELEGKADEARDHIKESVAIFEGMDNMYEMAKSYHVLGSFLCGLGNEPDQGRRILEEARDVAERIGAKGVLASIESTLKNISKEGTSE